MTAGSVLPRFARMSGTYFDYYEVALPERQQRPTINARDHFGIVANITMKFLQEREWPFVMDTEEFSWGLQGLHQAIEGFKPEMGWKFSTFAYYCIRNEIIKGLKWRKAHQGPVAAQLQHEYEVPCPEETNPEADAEVAKKVIEFLLAKHREWWPEFDLDLQVLLARRMQGLTLKEVSSLLSGNDPSTTGVTRERIRQREVRAVADLRKLAHVYADEIAEIMDAVA